MAKLLAEVLKQATVTLNPGDFLATVSRSEGYLPSRKDTISLAAGKYLFKVVDKDGARLVVPMKLAPDNKSLVEVLDRPVIVAKGTELTYTVGRNHPTFRDGYQGRGFEKVKGIATGQLDKEIVLAFIEFANTEFSLGVNDFRLGGDELLALGTPVTP